MALFHDFEGREITREKFLATGCHECAEKDKRIAELEREKDHANMVADAAAEKIKDLKDESAHAADSEKGGE